MLGLLAVAIFSVLAPSDLALQKIYDEATLKGRDAFIWHYAGCPQLMVHLRSWNELQMHPPMIVHASVTDRGMQVAQIQWEALMQIERLNRDVYFLMSCEGDALSSALHVLAKPLDKYDPKFSAVEKAEHLKLRLMFPRFSEATFVWSEGPFLDAASVSPWIWAPVGISQRGAWLVKLESDDLLIDQYGGMLLRELEAQNAIRKWSWAEPHFEHEQQFERFRFLLPWGSWLKSVINPREFFYQRNWQDDLKGNWKFVARNKSQVWIQYDFLGAREVEEIEAQLALALQKTGLTNLVRYQQIYFRPFMRSPLYGHEVEVLVESLEGVPQVKVAPIIANVESSSYLFRRQGMQTLEFSGLYSSHSFLERKRHENYEDVRSKAVAIHTEVFRDIMRR